MSPRRRACALISGLAVTALAVGSVVVPASAATSTREVTCSTAAATIDHAQAIARACDEDVTVLQPDPTSTLTALKDGRVRLDTTASVEETAATAFASTGYVPRTGTVQNSLTGSAAWDPMTEREWVGACDPAEVPPDERLGETILSACDAEPSSQRLVWKFNTQVLLSDLEPENIDSARLLIGADIGWFDQDACTIGTLEIYGAADWTRPAVGSESYAPTGCHRDDYWTGYFRLDATDVARSYAASSDPLTIGLKAADETCMACGWNLIRSAELSVYFNRAPNNPTDLRIGRLYETDGPCTSEPQWLNRDIYTSAFISDSDAAYEGEWVSAVFRVFPAGRSPEGTPIVEKTAPARKGDASVGVSLPIELFTDGNLYDLHVTSLDRSGTAGGSATCTFGVDTTAPAPPTITPVVGADAVYVADEPRGRPDVSGYFWVSGGDADVVTYRFAGGDDAYCSPTGTSAPATATTGFSYTPDDDSMYGMDRVVACAVDRAGNSSQTSTYMFDVSNGAGATPPAITVNGGSSYTDGNTYTSSITLSVDATTPYGNVTVSEGSTVLGGATFDARTKSVTIPAKKLAVGSHTLTYTYQAFPGAPKWSTTKSVRVVGTFVAPTPTISGTAKVGKTLTASRGTWTPTPSTVTYVWKAGSTTIKSSSSNQLVVPASARGKQITVSVVGASSGYTTKTVSSAKTAVVVAGTFTAPRPYLKGTVEYGHTVTAVRGTWSPSPSSVTYVWKINGTVVKRGTSSTLFLRKAWNGKQVTVTVIGSRTGYTSKTITSYAKTI
ncbi:hypothetical protein AB0F44_11590 [Nocardioides sp. NPDC023903]|uniref:hypothetical protein n=1 Tax=Nocardioides sp. NPDC023903 TaxID=3157195 RepID=UPI0033FC9391